MSKFTVRTMLQNLRLPVVCAPMFLVSGTELVVAQCAAGIIGTFPSLNARPEEAFPEWLDTISTALTRMRENDPAAVIAPYGVNLILAPSNTRLESDLNAIVQYRVPLVITSLRSPEKVVDRVHSYGGFVLHDVTTVKHARKAIDAGVDGLILVCAGAGGHAGALSPFALVEEIRSFYDGPLVLSGSITRGHQVKAAITLGCDAAYIGTSFIPTIESAAAQEYKDMVVGANASDILYTPFFSGVPANYLKPSVVAAGLDPENLVSAPGEALWQMGQKHLRPKAWKDIWGAGQGVGSLNEIVGVASLVERWISEFDRGSSHPHISPQSKTARMTDSTQLNSPQG